MNSLRRFTTLAYDCILYALVRVADVALRILPEPAAVQAAEVTIRLLERIRPEWRRVGERNLSLAGIRPAKGVLDGLRRSLARSCVHFSRMNHYRAGTIRLIVNVEGIEHYRDARRGTSGAVLVSLHLGNWELGGYTHTLLHGPLTGPANVSGNRRLDEFMARRREGAGGRSLPVRGSAKDLLEALRRGEDLCYLDELNPADGRGVFVSFFGQLACTSTVIPRIAAIAGAPVVPFAMVWDQDREKYVLRYYPAMPLTGDIECDTRKLVAWYESMIRSHIDQWIWIHMRWRTRPPGEPAVY